MKAPFVQIRCPYCGVRLVATSRVRMHFECHHCGHSGMVSDNGKVYPLRVKK